MSAWIGNRRLYSTNIMWHLYMTYVLPLFYLSSLITMFSRYYMSLFLILIFLVFWFFFSWCSVELWKVIILSLKLFIFTCIRNRGKKPTESPILVLLRPLTCTIKLIGIQHIRNVIKYVKLFGNQMSTKVVTCMYILIS